MKLVILILALALAGSAEAQQEPPALQACKGMLGTAVGRELDALASVVALQAEVARLRAENDRLQTDQKGK